MFANFWVTYWDLDLYVVTENQTHQNGEHEFNFTSNKLDFDKASPAHESNRVGHIVRSRT